MALLMNLLALVLVIGISWIGMMWLAGRVHGRRSDALAEREWIVAPIDQKDPCPNCSGVGALQNLGRLDPCPICEGTGVVTHVS